jgi:adenylate cyclase class 2
MSITNIEFKARVNDTSVHETKLQTLTPRFAGEDLQKDTYYNVTSGRLKLREGNIENALIWYDRPDEAGAKQANILLYKHQPDDSLKAILEKVHGIKVVVEKRRRIYFVENVKFHFDTVNGLGTFIEAEAIDQDGSIGIEKLKAQCDHYINFFGIQPEDHIRVSYSDLLLQQTTA